MLAIPRQTHPRTVASMNPPGTQILIKTGKDLWDDNDEQLVMNEKNVVQEKQGTKMTDLRSM